MELTKEQMKNLNCFLIETFAFTEEQKDAIDQQIPMTQEIFDSIIDRCNELGSVADPIFFRLLRQYPDFTDVYGGRIAKELDEKYGDLKLPEETPEERKASWEKLCARIRKEFGEDAI